MANNFLIICGTLPPTSCGIADFSYKLARRLCEKNKRVRIVTTEPDFGKDYIVRSDAFMKMWGIRDFFRLTRIIRDFSPERTIIQNVGVGYPRFSLRYFYPILIKKICHKNRIILFLHEYESLSFSGKMESILSFFGTDRVLSTKRIDSGFPFSKKFKTIRLPSTIPLLPNTPKHHAKVQFAVFFGYLTPHKGLELLLETVAELVHEGNALKLKIIGRDKNTNGKYEEKLKKMVKNLHIVEDVRFMGYLPDADVSFHLASSDFGILPFKNDMYYKSSALSAFVEHGLPSIVSGNTIRVHPDLPKGVCLMEPGNKSGLKREMKNMMKRLQEVPSFYENMGENRSGDLWEELINELEASF